jgi:hypothetical protein
VQVVVTRAQRLAGRVGQWHRPVRSLRFRRRERRPPVGAGDDLPVHGQLATQKINPVDG